MLYKTVFFINSFHFLWYHVPMNMSRTHSPLRKFFVSRLFLIVMVVVVVFLAINFVRAYYQEYKVKQEIAALREDVKHLEQKKLESLKILKYVTSDAFVEEKARTELNLKKPGEQVVVVTGQEEQSATVHTSEQDDQKAYLSNPARWWYYITHHSLPGE